MVQFFIGTQSLKPNNQIHCIELLSDPQEASTTYKTTVYGFPDGEIWQLRFSPHENDLLACTYSTYQNSQVTMKTALLRLPTQEVIDESKNNQEYLPFGSTYTLETTGSDIKTIDFNPSDSNLLATIVDDKLLVYNKTESGYTPTTTIQNQKAAPKFGGGKWSQHTVNQFICLQENSIKSYDIREAGHHATWQIDEAHGQQLIRDLDCNPNKQCHLVTGGDDGSIKIWDCRSIKYPIFTRSDHNHWVFNVRFNTFHDSLVLSSSSDGKVLLTCARSVSSEADEGTEKKDGLADGLLQMFEQHEDSVYCCEWSSVDPFVFASLSFDGRVIISQVPKQYKYQILM